MSVYVANRKLRLKPADAIGKGGEADVYDIGNDQVLKLFKPASHPDYANAPDEQHAAKQRLDVHQTKLPAFPHNLPARVVVPDQLATDRKRGGRVIGYTMPRIRPAEMLYHFGDPRIRHRGISAAQRSYVLADLRASVAGVHAAGVVIGDFNDLNVLVSYDNAYLIDADSYQFGGYVCCVYSDRFVDPAICDPQATGLVPAAPHSELTDWYAYCVMVFRTLLFVGPYGGVYKPGKKGRRVAHARRPLERISVFDPKVVYPKPAVHYRVLPDDLLHYLEGVFVRDRRGPFPAELVDDLRWTTCTCCGLEHARELCPTCAAAHQLPARASVRVRGAVTVDRMLQTAGVIVDARLAGDCLELVSRGDGGLCAEDGTVLAAGELGPHRWAARWQRGVAVGEPGRVCLIEPEEAPQVIATDHCAGQPAFARNSRHHYWLSGGQLFRDGMLGPEPIGGVVSEQTRFWVGERFGLGFYRAGALCVGFCFDADRGGLNDRVQLPLRGQLITASCQFGGDRAWLFVTERRGARINSRCLLISSAGELLATARTEAAEGEWLHASAGGCATARFLFAATDDGIVRVERDGDRLVVTRRFADTAPFVDAACRLHLGSTGIYAVHSHRVDRISIKETS